MSSPSAQNHRALYKGRAIDVTSNTSASCVRTCMHWAVQVILLATGRTHLPERGLGAVAVDGGVDHVLHAGVRVHLQHLRCDGRNLYQIVINPSTVHRTCSGQVVQDLATAVKN